MKGVVEFRIPPLPGCYFAPFTPPIPVASQRSLSDDANFCFFFILRAVSRSVPSVLSDGPSEHPFFCLAHSFFANSPNHPPHALLFLLLCCCPTPAASPHSRITLTHTPTVRGAFPIIDFSNQPSVRSIWPSASCPAPGPRAAASQPAADTFHPRIHRVAPHRFCLVFLFTFISNFAPALAPLPPSPLPHSPFYFAPVVSKTACLSRQSTNRHHRLSSAAESLSRNHAPHPSSSLMWMIVHCSCGCSW